MNRLACGFSLLSLLISTTAAQTLHPETTLDAPAPLRHAAMCEGGAQVIGVGQDGAIYSWTLPTATPRKFILPEGRVERLACSGKTLLAAFANGRVLLLDAASGEVRLRVDAKYELNSLALSPDSSLLATATNRMPTQLWDAHSGKLLFTTATVMGGSRAVVFSPNGELFVSLDEDAFIRGYDRQGKMLFITHDGLLQPYNVMFPADGKRFAVTGAAGGISLFDSTSGKKLIGAKPTGNPAFQSTISQDGKQILAIGIDDFTMANSAVFLWDLHSEAAKPLSIEAKNIIGLGAGKSSLLLIQQESPQKLTLYSIH